MPLANPAAYFAREVYAVEVEVYNPTTDRTETKYYATDGFTALLDLTTASVEVFPSPVRLRLVGDTATVEVTPTSLDLTIDSTVVTVDVTPRCVGLTTLGASRFTSGGGQLRATATVTGGGGGGTVTSTAGFTMGPPALLAGPGDVCNTSLSGVQDFGEDFCPYLDETELRPAYNWYLYP